MMRRAHRAPASTLRLLSGCSGAAVMARCWASTTARSSSKMRAFASRSSVQKYMQLRSVLCSLRCVMTKASITSALARRSRPRHSWKSVPSTELFSLLAVEAEGLEHRAVADREQDRVLAAGVRVGVLRPGGQRDDVALLPVEGLAFDHAAPLALHDMEHRAAGDAARLQLLALADQLHAARHRRHHRAAGLRVGVLERDALAGRAVAIAQRVQRLGGLVPGVEHERREARPLLGPSRGKSAVPIESFGTVDWLRRLRPQLLAHLEEDGVQRLGERHVEAVHPDDRLIGLVAVVVPLPARREDEIARIH